MIVVVITFIGIMSLVLGAYWAFVLRLDQSEGATLRRRLQPEPFSVKVAEKFRLLKPAEHLSSLGRLNSVLGQLGGISAPLQRDLTQAGLTKLTVGTLLLSAGCMGLAAYFIVSILTFNSMLGMAAGVAFTFVPFIYVR